MNPQNPRLISPLAAGSINTLLALIDVLLIKKIPYQDIQKDIEALFAPIKKTIQVLSDLDPNNKEQIKKVWLDFVSSDEFNNSVESRIMQAIAIIEDEKAKAFISTIVKPCFDTVKALYDNNQNNVEQIASTWKAFVSNKQNIQSIIHFFVKDESICEDIALIIDNLFENLKEAFQK